MNKKRIKKYTSSVLVLCMALEMQTSMSFALEKENKNISNTLKETIVEKENINKEDNNISFEQNSTPMSGSCGMTNNDNLKWSLESNNNSYKLIINGSGNMKDFIVSKDSDDRPWKDYIDKITEVKIGNKVTSIGDNAFRNLTALKLVNIPASIKDLGDYIFLGDSALTTVNWDNGFNAPIITDTDSNTKEYKGAYIPTSMFDGCTSLGEGISLTEWLPDSFVGVGCAALRNTKFNIDFDKWYNLKYIGAYAFYGMENLNNFTLNDKYEIGLRGDNVSNAFSNSGLNKINIDVREVPKGFLTDSKLKQFTLSDKVEIIDENAFMGTSITEAIIPKNVKTIKNYAFVDCKNLQKVAFKGETKLEGIIFADSILKEFVIKKDSKVTCTDNPFRSSWKYSEVSSLEKVAILGALKKDEGKDDYLWQQMFHNNAKIKEVVIDGKNATNFSQGTFPNIEELLITGEATNFLGYKFAYGTSKLKKVDIDVKNYSSESGSFRYASDLELFRLKADSAKFDDRAFYECPSIKFIDLTKCGKVEYSEGTFGTGVTVGKNNSPMNSKAVIYVKDTSNNPRTSGVKTGLSDKHGIVAITNGGTFDDTTKIEEGKLSTPTKDGYIFKGWYDNPEFKNEAITSFEVGKTYYAKWEEAVASVDGVGYTDLQTAINNANGKTVIIEKNIELSDDLEINGKNNVTIDFKGKTLSSKSKYTDKSLIKITDSTGITIKNANFDLSNGGDVAILVEGTSKVLLQENITSKKNNSDKAPVISLVGKNAKAELTKGSTINGKLNPDSGLVITDKDSKNNFTNGNNTGGGSVPSVPSTPSKPSKPVYTHKEVIGANRYETAAKVADELGSYDNVVLVNATSTMSDGLAASGLAGKENGAILLTKKDSIPKATMDRIKKVKKVYIIGGENAISQKVANQITAANIKVERIGGKNRVETSELVAEKLGNYSNAFIVNGFKGEADAMSASAIAARYEAPILLTNGKTSTHAKKSGVEYYVVGGTSVVNKSIADKYNAERLAGKDRYATNREVIDEFYSGSDKLYLANGETLVDALTASTIAKNHGIVLVNKKSDNSVLKDKNTVQIGGMNFNIDFDK